MGPSHVEHLWDRRRQHCVITSTIYFVGNFKPVPDGLKSGLTMEEVETLLGVPAKKNERGMLYNPIKTPGDHNGLGVEASQLFLYFENGALSAMRVELFGMC